MRLVHFSCHLGQQLVASHSDATCVPQLLFQKSTGMESQGRAKAEGMYAWLLLQLDTLGCRVGAIKAIKDMPTPLDGGRDDN
jgi:hypothetical protein